MTRLGRGAVAGIALVATISQAPARTDGEDSAARSPIAIVGSNTEVILLEAWTAAFADARPDVAITITGDGLATAPAALADGSATLGAMSRPMTRAEADRVEAATGIRPVPIAVALDAVAVIVHADNPLEGATLLQLDGIFSAGQACGCPAIDDWRDLVVGAPDTAIALHGRDGRSGTAAFFPEVALCNGPFAGSVTMEPDNAAIVAAVAADPAAIGFIGLGYVDDGVRPLAIGRDDDPEEARYFPFVVERYATSPDPARRYAYVFDGRYPLSRPLFLYALKAEGEALARPIDAFLRFALSEAGQAIVEDVGFVPLTEDLAAREAEKLAPAARAERSWLPWR